MPRIWMTRSQPSADESAAKLRALGYDVCTAPLLRITDLTPALDLPPTAYLIFTSRNGVRAFAAHIEARDWPCLCVGDATAASARHAGFAQVSSAKGAAKDVTAWACAHIGTDRPIYHISGHHPRGEVIENLSAFGFSRAQRVIFYRADPLTQDPRDRAKPDDIVLLYSPMAAQTFAALGLDMRAMTTVSLSAAVDEKLGDMIGRARFVAEHPSESSLFTHLPAPIRDEGGQNE